MGVGVSVSLNEFVFDKTSTDLQILGYLGNPNYYSERFISELMTINENFSDHPPTTMTNEDIKNLLFGCSEHVQDPDLYMNMLIRTNVKPDKEREKNQILFQQYSKNAISRNMSYLLTAARRKIYINKLNLQMKPDPKCTFNLVVKNITNLPDLLDLINFIKDLGKSLVGNCNFNKKIVDFFDILQGPVKSINIPLASTYYTKQNGEYFLIQDETVWNNTIASNGQFLFLLTDKNLYVFSLGNHGSLGTFKKINAKDFINSDETKVNSMIATSKYLYLNGPRQQYQIEIKKLLKTNILNYEVNSPESKPLSICSDGVSGVEIRNNRLVSSFDPETMEVQGTSYLLSDSLKNLTNILFYTNGAFLGVLKKNDNRYELFTYSLITRKQVSYDSYMEQEDIKCICVDSINRAYYYVVRCQNNIEVRRMNFIGSINPLIFDFKCVVPKSKKNINLLNEFYNFVIHTTGTQMIPKIFHGFYNSCYVQNLISSLIFINSIKSKKVIFLQEIIAILLEMAVRLSNTKLPDCLFQMFMVLPPNLSALIFFNNFDKFFNFNQDKTIKTLYLIAKEMKSPRLIGFCLHQLEASECFYKVEFNHDNELSSFIPHDLTPINNVNESILSLLLIHQRSLIAAASRFTKEKPFAEIEINANGEKTPLNYLSEYSQIIVNKFVSAITQKFTVEQLYESAIFHLFDNYARCLSILTNNHIFAQFMTALFSIVVQKDINLKSERGNHFLYFLFSKFSSILIQGGGKTEIEKMYYWLIRENIDVDQEIIKNSILDDGKYENPDISNFLLDEQNQTMELIYKKIKPQFNRNLNAEIKNLDKIVILILSKNLNILDDLFNFNQEKTQKFKQIFDQVIKIRNSYRQQIQAGNNGFLIRMHCLMLLRLKTSKVDIKQITDFILSKYDPNLIIEIMIQQKNRIKYTMIGIALVEKIFNYKNKNLSDEIIYALSNIKRFDGLSNIFRIADLKPEQKSKIYNFFLQLIYFYEEYRNNRCILIIRRFFRDITCFEDICVNLFEKVMLLDKNINSYDLIELKYSLLTSKTKFDYKSIHSDPDLYLFIEKLEPSSCTPRSLDYGMELLNNANFNIKLVFKLIKIILSSDLINEELSVNCFEQIMKMINDLYISLENSSRIYDMISFIRSFIIQNHPKKSILINEIKKTNYLISVFLILGNLFEPLRNYCCARKENIEYVVLPNGDSKFTLLKIPINPNSEKVFSNMDDKCIHPYPFYELGYESFGDDNFIFSFFNEGKVDNFDEFHKFLYFQVISIFSKNKEFIEKIPNGLITMLKQYIIAFDGTQKTYNSIFNLRKGFSILPKSNGFYVGQNIKFKTYLSPYIKNSTEVRINYDKSVNIGIVTDEIKKNATRSIFVCYPSGKIIPNVKPNFILSKLSHEIVVKIDVKNKIFTTNDENTLPFPYGTMFRLAISVPITENVEIKAHLEDFDETQKIKTFLDEDEPYRYFLMQDDYCNSYNKTNSEFAQNPETNLKLYDDLSKLPSGSEISLSFLTKEESAMGYFFETFPYHLGDFKEGCSIEIIDSMKRKLYHKLCCKFSTISLIRIGLTRTEILNDIGMRLLIILISMLEEINFDLFKYDLGFYNMKSPIWDESCPKKSLFLSLENLSVEMIKVLVELPVVRRMLGEYIAKNSKNIYTYLCPIPNSCICYGDNKICPGFFDKNYGIVYECTKESDFQLNYPSKEIAHNKFWKQASTIGFNFQISDSSYLNRSIFELILLLKNYIFMIKDETEKVFAKISLVNLFISNFKIVDLFIYLLLDLVQKHIITTPFSFNNEYIHSLYYLSISLKKKSSAKYLNFYQSEQYFYSHQDINLLSHFPEFFPEKVKPSTIQDFYVPHSPVNPGAIVNIDKQIEIIKSVLRKYTTIVGFPFWDILPFWILLTLRDKNKREIIPLELLDYNENIKYINNSNNDTYSITIQCKSGCTVPQDAIIMSSTSSDFEAVQNYIYSNELPKVMNIQHGKTYFSLTSANWNCIEILIPRLVQEIKNNNDNDEIKFNAIEIHDDFVHDMELFIKFTDKDIENLMNVIPIEQLYEGNFGTLESIVSSCTSLIEKFSLTVVKLHAMFAQHINYIRSKNFKDSKILESLSEFKQYIPKQEAMKDFIKSIKISTKTSSVEVNRVLAKGIIADGKGNPCYSIISQLSKYLVNPKNFQSTTPWKVSFKNESAIDAGGPARELITLTSESIFEPTTKLCCKVGELYVPFDTNFSRKDDYYSIGVFIGILLRTDYKQNFPFCSFVFNYLTSGEMSDDDIVRSDKELSDYFKKIKSGEYSEPIKWTIKSWNGLDDLLPGRSSSSFVKKEQIPVYIKESIEHRIRLVKPFLDFIRNGFLDNIEIHADKLIINGNALSYLIEGSDVITVEQFKENAQITDFSGVEDPAMKKLWYCIERFTPEQRVLFLRFVSGLTRIPNKFQFKVDKISFTNPNEHFPTASTCFNKLHWISYSSNEIAYEKLLYAIENCQTMELS